MISGTRTKNIFAQPRHASSEAHPPEDITETDTIYFLPPRNPGLRGIDAENQAPLSSIEEEIFYEPPSEPDTEDLSDEELCALFPEEGL